ncbi:hypothetical protein LCGC14_1956940 [marine sediment metagenome]|uniref:Uncharacterized protein n=1 Tax=marine sediment metagenome TaxID=412755 RepID=A0A0F9FFZ0_9ZZZZ
MAYTTTDLDLLKLMTYALLENGDADADGTGLLTTLWTISELTDSLNNAQRRFMKDTGIVLTISTLGGTPMQGRYTASDELIAIRRVTWKDVGGDIVALTRSSGWEADTAFPDWTTDFALPLTWMNDHHPTRVFEIVPAPNDIGQLGLMTINRPTELTGTGTLLEVPEEFASYVLWGALGELLGSEGEAADPQRASYCRQRYQEGVELARILLGGIEGAN